MKYLFILCLVTLPYPSRAQQLLKSIQSEFGGGSFTGLYYLDSSYAAKLKAYLPITRSCDVHILNGDPKMGDLSKWTTAYLNKLSNDKREKLLVNLERWCREDALLRSVAENLYEFSDFNQIIAETPATKHLLDKYLKLPSQYYGSLDFGQGCELYYDMVNYVFKLNKQQRLAFYKSYFNTACKIAGEEAKQQ